MRIVFSFLCLLMLMVKSDGAPQKQGGSESCGFAVQGEPTQATVTGPDDILPLVYVVEQPDSPIEVVSVDLEGTWVSVTHLRHTEHICAKFRVRNRSDKTVQKLELTLKVSTIGGSGVNKVFDSPPLAAGQSVDIESCDSAGSAGGGSVKDDYIRLLVYVDSVELGDCFYRPSLRIPRSLKIARGF